MRYIFLILFILFNISEAQFTSFVNRPNDYNPIYPTTIDYYEAKSYITLNSTADSLSQFVSYNGNALTPTGSMPQYIRGSIYFNGTDMWLRGSTSLFNLGTSDFTISVRIEALDRTGVLVGKMDGGLTLGWRVYYNASHYLFMDIIANGRRLRMSTGSSIGYGVHSISILVDRATNTVSFYVDSTSVSSTLYDNTLLNTDNIDNTQYFYLGRYSYTGSYYHDRLMAIRIDRGKTPLSDLKKLWNYWHERY